jgi:[ribosomal protein S5]-alanine N-acetyltransferase
VASERPGATEMLPTLELGLPGWVLRAWHESDAPSLAAHANNVNVWRWMSDSFPHPYTQAIAEHWVGAGHVEFGGYNWAITFEGIAVGGCGIAPLEGPLRCSAEVGWWLGEPYWGRGTGARVARTLVQRAFENPRITRVFAPIHAGNERSMAVARRAGMALEAVQRQSAVKDGRVIDRHVFVALRPD